MRFLRFILTILVIAGSVVYVSVNDHVSQYIKFIALNPSTAVMGPIEKNFTPEIKAFLAENVPGIWGTDYACKIIDAAGKSESAIAGQIILPSASKRYLNCPNNIKVELFENSSIQLLRNINKKYMGIELLSGSISVESEKTIAIKMKGTFHTVNTFWQGSRMKFLSTGEASYAICLGGLVRDDVKIYSLQDKKVVTNDILASFNCQLQATYSQLSEQEPRALFSEDALNINDLYLSREKQDPQLITKIKEALKTTPLDFSPRINLAAAALPKNAPANLRIFNWATNLVGDKTCTIYQIAGTDWRLQTAGVFNSSALTGSASFQVKSPGTYAAIRCDSSSGSISSLNFKVN